MKFMKDFRNLDQEELLLLLIVLPAERCVHLLQQLAVVSEPEKLVCLLKRLVEWEDSETEPLKELFALPMGINLLDCMFGDQYLPDTAPSGDIYWSYMVNGCRKAIDIIAQLGSRDAKSAADYIQRKETEMWERIKDHVFLWEDIREMADADLSLILRQLTGVLGKDEFLSAFLSVQNPDISSKLLRNLPRCRKSKVWDLMQAGSKEADEVLFVNEMCQQDIRNLVYDQIREGNIQKNDQHKSFH